MVRCTSSTLDEISHPKKRSSKYTLIPIHFHPKTISSKQFLQKRFRRSDTFVKKHFHPKNGFIQKMVCLKFFAFAFASLLLPLPFCLLLPAFCLLLPAFCFCFCCLPFAFAFAACLLLLAFCFCFCFCCLPFAFAFASLRLLLLLLSAFCFCFRFCCLWRFCCILPFLPAFCLPCAALCLPLPFLLPFCPFCCLFALFAAFLPFSLPFCPFRCLFALFAASAAFQLNIALRRAMFAEKMGRSRQQGRNDCLTIPLRQRAMTDKNDPFLNVGFKHWKKSGWTKMGQNTILGSGVKLKRGEQKTHKCNMEVLTG